MADWIRMRSSLLSNPRVTKMARVLLADREFLDWLCPGCDVPVTRDEAVTKRHIPVVTRVVVGGLLEVWSMVNDTAARDGIVRHASSRDIDETAGVPGFGAALMAVEWLEELPDGQGVYFPNFEEHNSPQKERSSVAKTGAERSREYRERKAKERDAGVTASVTLRDGKRDVTRDVTRDHREEESREEEKNTPPPPEGGVAGKRTKGSKTTKKQAGDTRVPADFVVTPEMEAWAGEKVPLVDWRRETENFRDWEFTHKRTDWPATWRTWMRKAQTSAEKEGLGRGSRGASDDWTGAAT